LGHLRANCAGLPRAWMHGHNSLSTRMVLYTQQIASASAGALGEAAFNRLQGSTGEASPLTLQCKHLLLSANRSQFFSFYRRTHAHLKQLLHHGMRIGCDTPCLAATKARRTPPANIFATHPLIPLFLIIVPCFVYHIQLHFSHIGCELSLVHLAMHTLAYVTTFNHYGQELCTCLLRCNILILCALSACFWARRGEKTIFVGNCFIFC